MMAKVTATKTVKKVRDSKYEFLTGYLRVYGETSRSLVCATFDVDDGCRCDSVYVIHKVSSNRVLNPYLNDDFEPVHDRITSVWCLVGR